MRYKVFGLITSSCVAMFSCPVISFANTNVPPTVNSVPLEVFTSHSVLPGDTLWKIAKMETVPVAGLEAANPQLSAHNLQVGQTVIVPRTWKVRRNESLFEISRSYGVSVESIEKLNSITDPKNLQIGSILIIPAVTAATSAPKYALWRVNPGESLWQIGNATGSSWRQLAALNAIGNPDNLQPGLVLLIPTNPQTWTVPAPSSNVTPPQQTPATSSTSGSKNSQQVAAITVEISSPVFKTAPNPSYNSWTYTATVTAVDKTGKPVPNEPLEVSGNAGANTDQVITNQQGQASFTMSMYKTDILYSPNGESGVVVKDDASNVTVRATFNLPSLSTANTNSTQG